MLRKPEVPVLSRQQQNVVTDFSSLKSRFILISRYVALRHSRQITKWIQSRRITLSLFVMEEKLYNVSAGAHHKVSERELTAGGRGLKEGHWGCRLRLTGWRKTPITVGRAGDLPSPYPLITMIVHVNFMLLAKSYISRSAKQIRAMWPGPQCSFKI